MVKTFKVLQDQRAINPLQVYSDESVDICADTISDKLLLQSDRIFVTGFGGRDSRRR